ncbi:hypothetical protein ACQY0O_006099 [Thecaphora frezii]
MPLDDGDPSQHQPTQSQSQSHHHHHANPTDAATGAPSPSIHQRRNLPSTLHITPTTHRSSDRASFSPVRSLYTGLAPSHHRQHRKSYDDQSLQRDMIPDAANPNPNPSANANGIRVWYESYTTIDWIHDAIKESSRLRRLRRLRGLRGALLNAWDRLQGWLIVTIAGIVTALIAGCIVKSEAVLFDLKDGYCQRDWTLAKRFCCPYAQAPDWDSPSYSLRTNATSSATSAAAAFWNYRTRLLEGHASVPTKRLVAATPNRLLAGWAGPVAGSPAWTSIAAKAHHTVDLLELTPETDACPGWITWAERLRGIGHDSWIADYGMYVAIAVLWATIASVLTIYLTSSELYLTSKNPKAAPVAEAKANGAPSTANGAEPDETTALLGDRGHRAEAQPDAAARLASVQNAQSSPGLGRIGHDARAKEALPPRKVLYFATGSGISEVKCILSGFVIHGYLGFWTLFTKSVGLTLSVASGLSLGKEGPFVHIASCVGNIVCRIFPKYENNEAKRREVLSCACAAGVAVAFGAPVGGVLFSLEEVSYYFPSKVMFRSFFCAMVAAATLRALDPFGTGKIVLFQVTYERDWHFYEMVFFVLIGVFGGLYGAYFTKLNMAWAKRVRAKTWMARHPILEVVMITVVSVAFSYVNGYTRMGGVELIADLFSECHAHESLEGLCVSQPSEIRPLVLAILWAMMVKGLLTIITFGIKLPAGIFIPTLAVGACFGRIVGLLVQYVQWTRPELAFFGWCEASDSACIVPGVYAMVGAAAALSGVTRTTVSLAVIMFELTDTLTYSVPVMLSILVAKTIADALEHKGIYDLVIDFSGLPYLDSKAEYIWEGVNVTDAMDTDVEVISLDEENTVASLRAKLARLALGWGYTDGGFPIVTRKQVGTGANLGSASASASPVESPAESQRPPRGGGGGVKMVGYIAANELEHALNVATASNGSGCDEQRLVCTFQHLPYVRAIHEGEAGIRDSVLWRAPPTMSATETGETAKRDEGNDLSLYVDKAPITVQVHSPLELVHHYFVRLGVKYLVVVDEKAEYKGIVFKKRYVPPSWGVVIGRF